jgi:hypothetical protein
MTLVINITRRATYYKPPAGDGAGAGLQPSSGNPLAGQALLRKGKTMPRHIVAFVVLCLLFASGTAYAQECLHGATENPDQAARRREALTATRNINNIQANQPGASKGQYLRHEELSSSPFAARMRESTNETVKRMSLSPGTDILPDWQLILDVTTQGYWFMIKDKTDPCGFAYVSNQAGVILRAEPIR